MSELKYFRNIKTETGANKRYRKLSIKYHPDKANNEQEAREFHSIFVEINKEHQEVLTYFKVAKNIKNYNKQQAETETEIEEISDIKKHSFINKLTRASADAYEFYNELSQEEKQAVKNIGNKIKSRLLKKT